MLNLIISVDDLNRSLASTSLTLDARRLDDGPPLLDLGLLVSGKRLRRLLLPRWKLKAHLHQSLFHLRITQGIPDRDVELVNNGSRRVPRREKCEPNRNVKSRKTLGFRALLPVAALPSQHRL